MKKFIRISAFLLALALIVCAVGCEGKKGDGTYTVGICQLTQHEALDAATEGFKAALTEKLGDKVVFDFKNASGEINNCPVIIKGFVDKNVDLIMANATPALTAAYNATETIPIVGTSITDYATALGIDPKDWTGKSGFNVTGTADLAPLDQQAQMLKDLLPDTKTVGILYCSAEANSKFQVNEITKHFNNLGIEVKTYAFADTNDATAIVTKAVAECDALYAPTDNTVASNGELIWNISDNANVPIITGEEGTCAACGIATFSISYYDIGYEAGLMAYEILVNGKDPADMDIGYTPEEKLVKKYVKSRCEKYGVVVPDGYVEIK